MTNPVVLYGTQSNGETLPVQVDGTGRLVAEGLPGPAGPDGPPGPPGPAGEIELPPDPYEGALLGWENGQLAWIGTPPVPIPEGVYGPITGWDRDNSLLTVDDVLAPELGTGVYIVQVDNTGAPYNGAGPFNTSKNWLEYVWYFSTLPGSDLSNGFDGNSTTSAISTSDFSLLGLGLQDVSEVKFYMATGTETSYEYSVGINNNTPVRRAGTDSSFKANPWDFAVNGTFDSLQVIRHGAGHCGIYKIEVDGEQLVLPGLGEIKGRINTRLSDTQLLVVPTNDWDFEVGQYIKVPSQRVAPWVLYGNDPTSLIDHLRRTRD